MDSIRNETRWPLLRAVARSLMKLLPAHNEILYRIARRIADRYNGDNDFDMHTNGELWSARLFLPGSKVVFDVGANSGDWTRAALSIAPDAHYHCFEVSRKTFATLRERLTGPNVFLNDVGLGEQSGEFTLWTYGDGFVSNSLYHRRGTIGEQTGTESVRVRTLDDYCEERGIEHIDFLKIDVEGHEVAVLKGARRMLQNAAIRAIQFEYGGTYIDARVQLKDIWELIEGMSGEYAFYKIYPRSLRLVSRYTQTYESFLYSNWLLLRRDAAAFAESRSAISAAFDR